MSSLKMFWGWLTRQFVQLHQCFRDQLVSPIAFNSKADWCWAVSESRERRNSLSLKHCLIKQYDMAVSLRRYFLILSSWKVLNRFFAHILPCILILSKFFYSPTDAQVNCLKNSFKIYTKIGIKTAPTCFGAVTPSSGSTLLMLAEVTLC
jgi:hypothetical protein